MPTSDDQAEILAALRVVGEAENVPDFGMRVCRELLRLVPGLSASYTEANMVAQRAAAIAYPDPGREIFARYAEVYQRHMHENPVAAHFEAHGDGDVVSWHDVDPEGRFRSTTLYRDFYAQLGIHSQLVFLLPAPPGIYVALAVNRDGTEFDERERALVSELRPHLMNLYRLVTHAEASRRSDAAMADDGWSVVLVDDTGTIIESNPVAVAIGDAGGVDLRVGASLVGGSLWPGWTGPDTDLWAWSRPTAPARVARTAFEARLLRSVAGPHVLWIREPLRLTAERVTALGLTARQAEITLLLADGLSNEQIGRRLSISSGTVRAHLDAIYERLGVSSRTAVVGRLSRLV